MQCGMNYNGCQQFMQTVSEQEKLQSKLSSSGCRGMLMLDMQAE